MKKLFLFTRKFPYGNGEPYLESEIEYYSSFDEVIIFSLGVLNDALREIDLPNHFKVYKLPRLSPITYMILAIQCLFNPIFYQELKLIRKNSKLTFKKFVSLVVFLTRAEHDKKKIERLIDKEHLIQATDEVVLYSYRFDYSAFVATQLEVPTNRTLKISRAHGIDLYHFRSGANYLPLREYILDDLDYLVLISKQGQEYMLAQFPEYADKYMVSYLGTRDLQPNFDRSLSENAPFEIVSISLVNPVKRLPLLYEALQFLDEPIRWTHFGGGPKFEALEKLTKGSRKNIEINLMGHLPNEKMLHVLQATPFDLFVNVSESEGLPVSIMEAMSIGIPVIATDVGGTNEIVKDQVNGYLVPKDITAEQLAAEIRKYRNLSAENQLTFKKNARETWEASFSAHNNYEKFVQFMLNEL